MKEIKYLFSAVVYQQKTQFFVMSSLISMRLIYFFDPQAIISHGILPLSIYEDLHRYECKSVFVIVARLKVPFIQKVRLFQISQKNYCKKLSWAWNLKFPPITVNNLFKFQAQDNFFWNGFFGRLEKRISLWGHSTTTWTKFWSISTPSPPRVDKEIWICLIFI